MKKVDFFIIGAAKSGTTALTSYLTQHPDVCMAKKKESHYFVYKDGFKEFNGHSIEFRAILKNSLILV